MLIRVRVRIRVSIRVRVRSCVGVVPEEYRRCLGID